MPKLLTQHGTDAVPSYSTLHSIPVQLNTNLSATGDMLAPIFNCGTSDYTLVSSATVTVTVTVISPDAPVTTATALEEETTYTVNSGGVVSITVQNSADTTISAYAVNSITLPEKQFSYKSKKSGSNLVFSYTATYRHTSFAKETGTYWYIIKLPKYHCWDLTGNNNPLYHKTVIILPWVIAPKSALFSQISLIENDILNIVNTLNQNGYHLIVQNTDTNYFDNFASYLRHLDINLVEKAYKGDSIIKVDNNEDIFIGNKYVLSNKMVHELVTVTDIKSLYNAADNDITYKLTLSKPVLYNYNIGSSLSPNCYYVTKSSATLGRDYRFINTAMRFRDCKSFLSTKAVVTVDATAAATSLTVTNAANLEAGQTYHLMENKTLTVVTDKYYQTVKIKSVSGNTVELEKGLETAIFASNTPTFFYPEKKESVRLVYQTWCNRTDLENPTVVKSDNLYISLTDAKHPTLDASDLETLKSTYWTGIKISAEIGKTTASIQCSRENNEQKLIPGKKYFVTTLDSTSSSYGRITVKDFTASGMTGTIKLVTNDTLGITVTDNDTPSRVLTGSSSNPLYVFEMLPSLSLHRCYFFYTSNPKGTAITNNNTVYDITTRYTTANYNNLSTAIGNMAHRVVIYRRIVPFPLSIAYRNRMYEAGNASTLTLEEATKNRNYSSDPFIGDLQFWEKSDIVTILGEETYGYKIEWPVSVEYMTVEGSTKSFTGYEGWERFRCWFNCTSSTYYTPNAYLYGTLNTFEELPSVISLNAVVSSKGSIKNDDYSLSLYYAAEQSKTGYQLEYSPASGGYTLSYVNTASQTQNFSNFRISQLLLTADSQQNIAPVVTYNNKTYVNWYVDYDSHVIRFPKKTFVFNNKEITNKDINTEGHKIFVDITYDCQDIELANSDNADSSLMNKGIISSATGTYMVPYEYTVPVEHKNKVNVKINFMLKILSRSYSTNLAGTLTKEETKLTMTRAEVAKEGLTFEGIAYSDADCGGDIYHQAMNPYTGILQPVGAGAYDANTTLNSITLEDMLDYVNGAKTLQSIKGYRIVTRKTYDGFAGIGGSTLRIFTRDVVDKDFPWSLDLPTADNVMCNTWTCPSAKQLSTNSPVRLFLEGASALNSTSTETVKAYKDKFINTYCKPAPSGSGYVLKTRSEIKEYYDQPENSKTKMASYMQCIRVGNAEEKYPPALMCGYLTADYTFSTATAGDISYHVANKAPVFSYDLVSRLKEPSEISEIGYFSTLTLNSSNFNNVNFYKELINNPSTISGLNCRFFKVKLQKSLIDEYAGRYLGVITDITPITVTTNTQYNPTKVSGTSGSDVIFWTETDNPDDIVIWCSFRMDIPRYNSYGRLDTLLVTYSGKIGPYVQGFVNKWIF